MWHLGRQKEQEGQAQEKQMSSEPVSMGLREYLQLKGCGLGCTKRDHLGQGLAVHS